MRTLHVSVILWAYLWCNLVVAQSTSQVAFGRDVQPILREHCFGCHGPSQQMRGRSQLAIYLNNRYVPPERWGLT